MINIYRHFSIELSYFLVYYIQAWRGAVDEEPKEAHD